MRKLVFLLALLVPTVASAQKNKETVTVSCPGTSIPTGANMQCTANLSGVQWQSSNTAVATVTQAGLVSARAAGTTTIRAKYRSQQGSVSLTVTQTPPPPPPPPVGGRGPSADIHCPAGAINISTPTDPSDVVANYPAGTSFCLQPGTYQPARPLYMQQGDTLTGEFGAVIDGVNVYQPYDTGGISIISGWNCGSPACGDVTVRNVAVTNTAPGSRTGTHLNNDWYMCIGVAGTAQWDQPPPAVNSDRWVIDHVEVSGCSAGFNLTFSGGHRVTNSYTHDNLCNLGGYVEYDTLWENIESARSGSHDCKWADNRRVTIRNFYAHDYDSESAPVWFDGGNNAIIEDSVLNCSSNWPCVDIEIHVGAILRNTVINVHPDGTAGSIFFTNSADSLATGNTINGPTGGGAVIFWDGEDRLGQPWPRFPTNNRIIGNTFNLGVQGTYKIVGFQCSTDPTTCQNRLIVEFGNYFDSNTYKVQSLSGTYWYANTSPFNWTTWLSFGQDPNGSIVQQ